MVYKEPWTATVWDQLNQFSLQLAVVGGSGALAKTAMAPLERVKVRTSVLCLGHCQEPGTSNSPLTCGCGGQILMQVQAMSSTPPQDKYKGVLDALRRIPQREGWIVRPWTMPCMCLCLCMRLGVNAPLSLQPELLVPSLPECMVSLGAIMMHGGGGQALYRGNGANVLRLVPEVGTSFLLNEQLRIMFTPPDGRPIGFEGRLAAGAATGIIKVPQTSRRGHAMTWEWPDAW